MTTSTLDSYAQQELPRIYSLVSPSTASAYERGYRLRVKPSLGHIHLHHLLARDIENAYYAWSGTSSTKADALAVLSRIIKRAIRDGHMTHNPVRDIEKPRQYQTDEITKALSQPELTALFEHVPEQYHFFFGLMAFAGLRFAEAAGIFPHDIEIDNRLITVSRQLHRSGDIRPTKGRRSRVTPITADLYALIPGHLPDMKPSTLVNRTPQGAGLHSSNLSRALKWREIRNNIRPGLRYHDLRHHAATSFLAAGVPLNFVQAFLGHSNVSVTSRYIVTGRNEALTALSLLSQPTLA